MRVTTRGAYDSINTVFTIYEHPLWIGRKGRMTRAKCPLRLEIESRLRSWLLRVSGMPLHTLTYAELRLITEGRIAEAKCLHVRGHDTHLHRPDTRPTPAFPG